VQTAVRAILERRYSDLTRIAYLVLDDGQIRPGALLGAARHLVRSTAARSWAAHAAHESAQDPGETYAELRRRLAGRLVAEPPTLARLGIRYGLRPPGAAAPAPDGGTRTMLRKLSRHERLVYVLARVEGLAVADVAGELAGHLAVTVDDVARTLADVDAATGLDAAEQTAELRAFDPTVIRLRPPSRGPRRGYVIVAAALAVLVAAGTVAYAARRAAAPRPGDPLLVAGNLWQREQNPDITVWPTQGDRTDDLGLLRRARDSWQRVPRTPPVGQMYVLFAGDLGDSTTVIMRDSPGNRGEPLVAHYVERPLSRGVESVRQLGIGAHDVILIDALANRFLVPPWRPSLRVSPLNTPRPEWRDLAVRAGVSDPLPWSWFDVDCQFYVAFQAAERTASQVRTITMLASHVSASATPRIAFRVPGRPQRYDDTALDSQARWASMRALACDGGVSLEGSPDLRVGELWRGDLPDAGGTARLLTVERSGGSAGQIGDAVLVADDGRTRGYGDSNSDHVLRADELAAAVWWRSRRSSRWYLVVAAAPRVPRYYLLGELGRHEPRGRSFVLRGPVGVMDVDERPVVQVVVHEPDGDRSVIMP
jgi:hypothetical protein